MLNELCAELRNYFLRDYTHPDKYIHYGEFTVQDGAIQSLPFLKDGQYFRIIGSTFNDGVHKYGDRSDVLTDETFEGAVWEMFVPPAVIALVDEIGEWVEKNSAALDSPYQSESTPIYSRTYRNGTASNSSGDYGWQDHFGKRLKQYRRACIL